MLRSSGPLTEIKLIPASLATAFANRVLPQPGGPQSKTPAGVTSPKLENSSENCTGAWKKAN